MADIDDTAAGDGWGLDADMGLDGEEPSGRDKKDSETEEAGGWDVGDEDLDLPEDVALPAATSGGEGYFVPPTRGASQAHVWVTNSQLAADHVSSGAFESAFKLLHDQVSDVEYEIYNVRKRATIY